MKIVLNPSPFEEKILNWPLEKVSLFLLNEVEGGQMTGEKEPEKILKRLQAKYPNADFVLTYGEKGAWYVGNGERRGSYEKRSCCIYSLLERTGRKIRV